MAAASDEGEARTRRSTTARLELGLGPPQLSSECWRERFKRFIQFIPSFQRVVLYIAERIQGAPSTSATDQLREDLRDHPDGQLLYHCYRYLATYVDTKYNPLDDIVWVAEFVGFSAGRSIGDSLNDLDSMLLQIDGESHQICTVNASAASRFELSFYFFIQSVYLTIINKRGIASKAVTIFVTRLLRLRWGIEDLGVEIDQLLRDPPPTRKLQRPSVSAANPQRVFESQECCKQEWRWLRMCPIYVNDFREYVWDPFAGRPELDALRVVIQPATGELPHSVSLITSSARVLHRLKAAYLTSDVTTYDDPKGRTYALLAMIHEVINVDVTNFDDYAARQVDHVELLSRRSPSGSKIHFLFHLKECHTITSRHCLNTIKTLATVQEAFSREFPQPLLESQQKLVERFDACAQDFAFLSDELETRANEIDRLVSRIKDMMDVRERRRSQFITFLVSIYVPLAFATSFFGMNLQDKSSNPPNNINWPVWQF